jgi:tetratricopeptide (TPR) repeat protein
MLGGVATAAMAEDDRREYDALFHEAMLQRQKGNADASFDLLLRCVELDSTASEAYFFLSQGYGEMKQHDKALACIERAASLEPHNFTYMEMLATAYLGSERYKDAIVVVEKMYAQDKSRQQLLETLLRLYNQEGDYAKAIDVVERMELADGESEVTSVTKSSLYLQMGENERAAEVMKTLADSHPYDLRYQIHYANIMLLNGEREEALAVLQQVLKEEPDNTRAQQALRNYYQGDGDSVAVDSITRAILLNPKTTGEDRINQLRQVIAENEQAGGDSTSVLALFREMLNQPKPEADIAELLAAYMDLKKMPRDSVAQALQQVLLLAPDRASARMHLVQMAWEADDNDRIISLCQAAREYNPEEMAFYYYQGMAYYRQDDTDHALEAFQNGINVITEESSPVIVSDFYAIMGDLLFQKHREREAYEAYDSCLQWQPDNIGCLNNYAYYLSLKGDRLDEAEQMSYKTIKAQPKNATYLDTYAWILFMQHRYAEARIYIDQALQNDSTAGAVVIEHAGDIYALSGDIEGALGLWQQALEQDPGNKLLARKIKRKKYIKQ